MKKKLLLLGMLACTAFGAQSQTVRNCGTTPHQAWLEAQNPGLSEIRARIERDVQAYVESHPATNGEVVYNIPVVVHVVYNGATQNISDTQIQSQLTVLNADFRRLNADASLTPSAFAGVAVDCEINFCLATRDPSGATSTGITRTSTTVAGFADDDAVKHNSTGGKDAWPSASYLNLWVCNLSGSLLGYAQFPGGPAATDGVVIDYQYFGTTGTATAPFNKGRTATHEVGHWLNLYHIWGDDDDQDGVCEAGECSGSDAVTDTPNQCEENYGCPTFPRTDGCTSGNGVMFMNYMDYTDDACMNMFTAGQKSRMVAVLATGGSRASLASSTGCSGGAPTYCASSGGSTADEWIQSVVIGSFSNTSGNNSGYGNYTGSTITLVKGTATSFTLTPGFTSTAFPEYWKIWVDNNGDKDFSDAGELLYNAGATSTTARTGTITAPTSAITGTTRMRVSMKYNGAQTECEAFSYGEVEDYTVNLTTGGCSAPTGLSAGSITSSGATLSWTAVAGATSYNIQYKVNGGPTWTTTTSTTNSKALTGLTASTTYNWQVQAVCSGGSSTYTAGTNFTTSAATCTDAFEANETSAAAKTISVNTNNLAKICTSTDIDWFKFTTVSSAPKVKIDLTTLPADYDVTLYASNATTVLGSGTNGGTTSEQIKYNTATTGATYYVKVFGFSGAFNTTTSYTLRASTQAANWRDGGEPDFTPKEALTATSDFILAYPNPTSGDITLNYVSSSEGMARITVIDLLGREHITINRVVNAGENNFAMQLADLSEGIYMVRVATDKGISSVKVQVVK